MFELLFGWFEALVMGDIIGTADEVQALDHVGHEHVPQHHPHQPGRLTADAPIEEIMTLKCLGADVRTLLRDRVADEGTGVIMLLFFADTYCVVVIAACLAFSVDADPWAHR